MNKNIKRISPLLFIIAVLIASSLIGIAESKLLLGRTEQYCENVFWKVTGVFYVITMTLTFLLYFTEKYSPYLVSMFKFGGVNLFLSIPYFGILVYERTISLNTFLTFLPAQIIFLAAGFNWNVANEIDPDLSQHTTKIGVTGLLIGVFAIFTVGLLGLSDSIVLAIGSLALFCYSLLLLKQAVKRTQGS